jgi:L-seryl-tRNA(Ser) seleniumtransferase
MSDESVPVDSFGNPIDREVAYARGSILRSSVEEAARLRNAQKVAGGRVRQLGPGSIGVFTGNPRSFPIGADDLDTICEEWVGPSLYADDLRRVALDHLGGEPSDAVTVLNRSSAGIIATILALANGRTVVSIAPPDGHSHVSVMRGCVLAGVDQVEAQADGDWRATIDEARPALVVVTTVTSSLERLDDEITRQVADHAHGVGAKVFLDEAYGARLRPVLHGGRLSLQLGADLTITNSDKAGLNGPRSGVLAGRPDMVAAVAAKGGELGMEARAPIAAGALRSLQAFTPDGLREEAATGQKIAVALEARLGQDLVRRTDLGPMIHQDDVLALARQRAGEKVDQTIVPCEATAALGILLLRNHGILTVNTHGQPGGRVSLRLKPTADAVQRVGGIDAIVAAVEAELDTLAGCLGNAAPLSTLILGDEA